VERTQSAAPMVQLGALKDARLALNSAAGPSQTTPSQTTPWLVANGAARARPSSTKSPASSVPRATEIFEAHATHEDDIDTVDTHFAAAKRYIIPGVIASCDLLLSSHPRVLAGGALSVMLFTVRTTGQVHVASPHATSPQNKQQNTEMFTEMSNRTMDEGVSLVDQLVNASGLLVLGVILAAIRWCYMAAKPLEGSAHHHDSTLQPRTAPERAQQQGKLSTYRPRRVYRDIVAGTQSTPGS
jgi:hypothetical protein